MSETGLGLDFLLEVYVERVEGKGEDSYLYADGGEEFLVAVFDGCGGSGARGYTRAHGLTGAYLASRIMSGAVKDWFETGQKMGDVREAVDSLKRRSSRYLLKCRRALAGESLMRGTLAKELPTTCALMVWPHNGRDALAIWAGDSRCFKFDASGLHQLTIDDVDGYDPMENLHEDGVLTNIVSASGEFVLHSKQFLLDGPCILFAATDGCFGYVPTPMHFERMLLESLDQSMSPADWERRLYEAFSVLSGDDATLCGMCIGFGTFEKLKNVLAMRRDELYDQYLCDMSEGTDEIYQKSWRRYRIDYLR